MRRFSVATLIFFTAVGCQAGIISPTNDEDGGQSQHWVERGGDAVGQGGDTSVGGQKEDPAGQGGEAGGDVGPGVSGGEAGNAGTQSTGAGGRQGGGAGRTGAGGKAGSSGTGGRGAGGAGTKAGGGGQGTGGKGETPTEMTCTGHGGPAYEDFYDNGRLATFRITVDNSSSKWLDTLWGKWKHCPPHPSSDFFSAQVKYEASDLGNVTCENVGMRLRGSWKRGTNQTQGFKLDFQVLDSASGEKRRFADLNRVNVLSIESDPSHMIQCLTYKYLRDFGLPAPRCNHVKVYVNNSYYGLLENVEQVNKGFVRRHFGSNEGYLFAGSPSQGDCSGGEKFEDSLALLKYSGDSFSSYSAQYQLTKATAADAEKTLIPMLKCGDATQTSSDSDFKTCIGEWLDVEEWLKQIAAESLIPALQSWLGYYRNFYLYFNPDEAAPHGGRFAIWSWDMDTSFDHQKCYPTSCDPMTSVDSLYGPRNVRAKLVTRLTTVYRSEYCSALKSFLKSYTTDALDEMASTIEPGLSGEPSVNAQTWQTEVKALRTHITNTRTNMEKTVGSACP